MHLLVLCENLFLGRLFETVAQLEYVSLIVVVVRGQRFLVALQRLDSTLHFAFVRLELLPFCFQLQPKGEKSFVEFVKIVAKKYAEQ